MRERYVAEQNQMVLGALSADGLHQMQIALANGSLALINFGVDHNFDTAQTLARLDPAGTDAAHRASAGRRPRPKDRRPRNRPSPPLSRCLDRKCR